MPDSEKCFLVCALGSIIAIVLASVFIYAIKASTICGESLVIEYTNDTPYERTLPNLISNSITNEFKIKKYSMDKHSVRIEFINPPDQNTSKR